MGQIFVGGIKVPVTRVLAGPCIVTQIKRIEKDGYWAVQLGFGQRKIKNTTKPMQGHLGGELKDNAPRFLSEVKVDSESEFEVGDTIKISDIFSLGDKVMVSGMSKGKGFAGVVKRWKFSGGPKTHGQSDRERAPGSIGQGTTPGRVYRGKRMAGRMGGEKVSVKNLQVVSINPDTDELMLKGAVPGTDRGFIKITKISSGKLEELKHETQKVVIEEGGDLAKDKSGEASAQTDQTNKKEENNEKN